MSLTDTTVRSVKSTDKQQKLFDGGGLFLLVAPTGTKSWRLKYRFQGKEKLITLGLYPLVSLKDARERAITAKKLLADGKDPSMERKRETLQFQTTFELVAREWHEKQAHKWATVYYKRTMDNLEKNAFPYIGSRPIADISAQELLMMLRRLESRGTIATAHAVRGLCSSIFRYAVATGRAERNPIPDLYGALTPHVKKHHPAITDPDKVGELMLKIDDYHGMAGVRCALQLMALTFCRSAEIRHAEWAEFDFEDKLWRIPGEKMKMSRDHIVPLSEQAIAVVNMFSDHARYVFINQRNHAKPLGVYSLISALRIMGYAKEEISAQWPPPCSTNRGIPLMS